MSAFTSMADARLAVSTFSPTTTTVVLAERLVVSDETTEAPTVESESPTRLPTVEF